MRSVNFPIRKIYHSKLNTLVYNGAPVKNFYQKAPDEITDANYIVFGAVTNADVSSKQKSNTDTTVQVTIHSFASKYNDGRAADDIAGLIFDLIYPESHVPADLSADGLQLVDTVLSSDVTQAYNIQGTREYLDRVLTFTHRIYHQ